MTHYYVPLSCLRPLAKSFIHFRTSGLEVLSPCEGWIESIKEGEKKKGLRIKQSNRKKNKKRPEQIETLTQCCKCPHFQLHYITVSHRPCGLVSIRADCGFSLLTVAQYYMDLSILVLIPTPPKKTLKSLSNWISNFNFNYFKRTDKIPDVCHFPKERNLLQDAGYQLKHSTLVGISLTCFTTKILLGNSTLNVSAGLLN